MSHSRKEKHTTQFNLHSLQVIRQHSPRDIQKATTAVKQEATSMEPTVSRKGMSRTKEHLGFSTDSGRKILRGKPRELALPSIVKSGSSTTQVIVVRKESPWDTFQKLYECDLAGIVAIAVRR